MASGYTETGMVRRWPLPRDLQVLFSINLLELIATIVNTWLILYNRPQNKKILCFTDSSSALGWLYHSTFNPVPQPLHNKIVRRLARTLLNNKCTLYLQHIRGKQNFCADCLSRDHHTSMEMLTETFYCTLTNQEPQTWKEVHLLKKIASWIYYLKDSQTA